MDAWPEMPKLPQRCGMKGGSRDARLAEGGQPPTHLGGSLVGKGDDQDVARAHDAGRQGVPDPSGNDSRLAGPRSGEDAQRTRGDRDGLALGRIEVGEKALWIARRHLPIVAGRPLLAVGTLRRTGRAPVRRPTRAYARGWPAATDDPSPGAGEGGSMD